MIRAYLVTDPLDDAKSTRRYEIREKIFSLRDNYKVKDELDQDVFIVRSKLLTMGDNMILEDMTGNGLVKIEEELLHLNPTYKILSTRNDDAGRQLALVKKKFSLHETFSIDSVYGEYKLEALDLLGRLFTLIKEGHIVATVSRKYDTVADAYEAEIDGNEDHALIIALIIIISQSLGYY
ncbi:unnamed protein product [Rotaria sp. Silwood1]|nr:unnamed protein product [Rotaria sp. Silwood1]